MLQFERTVPHAGNCSLDRPQQEGSCNLLCFGAAPALALCKLNLAGLFRKSRGLLGSLAVAATCHRPIWHMHASEHGRAARVFVIMCFPFIGSLPPLGAMLRGPLASEMSGYKTSWKNLPGHEEIAGGRVSCCGGFGYVPHLSHVGKA